MVMQAGLGNGLIQPQWLKNLEAPLRMRFHDGPFLLVQRAGLVEHGQGNAGLAYIVQQAYQTCLAHAVIVLPHAARQTNHQRTHGDAMHIGVVIGRLQAREADQGMRIALDGKRHLIDQLH